MITEEKFVDILRKLLAKSRANEVNWQERGGISYEVTFLSGALIGIIYEQPDSEPDFAVAYLNVGGKEVIKLSAEEGDAAERFPVLKDLYMDASRCVFGWDAALEELKNALNSKGAIGVERPPGEEEIPF